MNLVEAQVENESVFFGGYEIQLPRARQPELGSDGTVILGIRPESFEDALFAPADLPTIDVVAEVVEELGAETHLFFTVDAPRVNTEELRAAASGEDDTLLVEHRAVFAARVDPASRLQPGGSLKLAVDTSRLHFFDPASGVSLLRQSALAAQA
jgi:multiple sugar transport system ATP-binding protein